ncbi:hypothetical protein HK096_006743, partial [Nowakowskiella sp. JEL0078]
AAGTGKSSFMNVVREMFTNIGTFMKSFEKTFSWASLYDREVVIVDEVPKNVKDVFDQTTL